MLHLRNALRRCPLVSWQRREPRRDDPQAAINNLLETYYVVQGIKLTWILSVNTILALIPSNIMLTPCTFFIGFFYYT